MEVKPVDEPDTLGDFGSGEDPAVASRSHLSLVLILVALGVLALWRWWTVMAARRALSSRNLVDAPVRSTVAGESLWRKLRSKGGSREPERSRLMDRWAGGDTCHRVDLYATEWT